jgi:secondary thiamine-phosphate synthase enzyme
MLKTLGVRTQKRNEIVDISGEVAQAVRESGVKDGLCVVFVPHTTAGVTINENADPDVKRDMVAKLAAMVPEQEGYYRHGEGNSDAHIKTALVGPSITVIVDGGELMLGTWQGIYFCEFDGPRQRKCHVKVVKG